MEPLVSVVLPCYNGQKFLAQSIESVLNQTYKNLELIFVDDCSTDNSLQIAKEYAEKDSRIKIIKNETNQKLPESLNIGFRNANGALYSWTSDDNFYHDEALEEMVKFLENNPDYSVVRALCKCVHEDSDETVITKNEFTPQDLYESNSFGACFLYKKEAALAVGEYDKETFLAEDYDYWLRLALYCKIGTIEKVLYTYRVHAASLTSTHRDDVRKVDLELKKRYLPLYQEKFPGHDWKGLLNNAILAEFSRAYNPELISTLLKMSDKRTVYKYLKSAYKDTLDPVYQRAAMRISPVYFIKALLFKRKFGKNDRKS